MRSWIVGYHREDRSKVEPDWHKVLDTVPGLTYPPPDPKLYSDRPKVSVEFLGDQDVAEAAQKALGPLFNIQPL